MDSCLRDFVNESEVLGTAGTGFAWVEFYLKFNSHSWATGLGPIADWWARVCKFVSMNLKPLGTAGSGSDWGEYYLKFFFHFWTTGLGPAVDGWARVCNFFSINLKPLGTAGTCSVSYFFYWNVFSLSRHWIRPSSWLQDLCFLDSVNDLEAPGHYRDRLCLGCYFFEIFFSP
jgi:hypothetical protein